MRLLSKLTSSEPSVIQTKMQTRVLLPVLFLLALSSCSVSKQLWTRDGAQQNLDANSLSASDRSPTEASGGNNTVISNTRSQDQDLGESTSTAQQSDINRKTSPAIVQNAVRGAQLPALSSLRAVKVQPSDILGIFLVGSGVGEAISVNQDGHVYRWDLKNQRSFDLFKLYDVPVDATAVSVSKNLLAAAHENELKIFSLIDGSEIARLNKLKSRVSSLAFQPSGQSLVIGSADGEVYRWRFEEERTVKTAREAEKLFERYFGHSSVISAVAYHPIGRIFFSGDWSGALNAWLPYDADAFGGQYLENAFGSNMFSDRATRARASRSANASIERMVVSPDGEALIVAGQDGSLEWWQVRGFTLAAKIDAHKGLIYDIAFAPSGRTAATLGRDGKVRIWTLTTTVSKEEAKTTFTLDKTKELEAPGNRKLIFLDESALVLGDQTGRISLLKL